MQLDLTSYVPRLILEWEQETPRATFREIDGTLVFIDLSGFTSMSERLARKGKVGAEEITEVLGSTFSELLTVAYQVGGSLLKFGGDALLLFFPGPDHATRACYAAGEMRRTLRSLGRIKTSAGPVTLRMSVGIHSGNFHFFLVGESHRELIVTGPEATQTVLMESTAEAGEILASARTSSLIDPACLGEAKGDGLLLKKIPEPSESIQPQDPKVDNVAQFIPSAIRAHLTGGGHDPEHRQVTVAFIHFDGTDRLIGDSGGEETAAKLSSLVASTQANVDEHGLCFLSTDIDKDGGKIILAAGAPQTFGNPEERMLRAVRAIADTDHGIAIRFGVNRGYVFAGDIGPHYRRTYTVMGDAVNTAARVMMQAQEGQLLATEGVLDRSSTLFRTSELAPFTAKGKAQPLVAYDVGAIVGVKEREVERHLPLVGRDQQLAELSSALESARSGAGRVAEIVGEAGVGKSRLVEELRTAAEGCAWISTWCEQYETSTPYFIFRHLLVRLLDVDRDADSSAIARRLRERVAALAPQLTPWLSLLAIPLDISIETTPEVERLDANTRKGRLNQVVKEFVTAAMSHPTVWVIEDAHWMDEASGTAFNHLLKDVQHHPWLVCITRRYTDTGFAADPEIPKASFQLQPLEPTAAVALVRVASGEMLLPRHEIEALAERAGGNPLFLQELLEAFGQNRDLEALPESVEGLIASRIDRLSPADRALLRHASVLGATFSTDLLGSTLDRKESVDEGVWQKLATFIEKERTGLIRFRHALYRDAAYEGLPYRRRRSLHKTVGEVLERQGPDESIELLSLHFFRAQEYEKAWNYSRAAGQSAQAKFANIEAADFFKRALESARKLEIEAKDVAAVWEALGAVCDLAALYPEADRALRNARKLRKGEVDAEAYLLYRQGQLRFRVGRYSQALRWYGRGLRLLATSEGNGESKKWQIRLLLSCAQIAAMRGDYQKVIELAEESTVHAERSGDKAGLAHSHALLHFAYMHLGRSEKYQYRELPLRVYEEIGDLVGLGSFLITLGEDAAAEYKWEEARNFFEKGREVAEKSGRVQQQGEAANGLGELLLDQGKIAEAESRFQEALSYWQPANFRFGIAVARANLGRLLTRLGKFGEAKSLLEQSLAELGSLGANDYLLIAKAGLVENLAFAGRYDEAKELATRILGDVEDKTVSSALRAKLWRLGGLALAQANHAEARSWLQKSLELARSGKADFEIGLTLKALAELLTSRGEDSEAYEREAQEIFRRLSIVWVPPALVEVPMPTHT